MAPPAAALVLPRYATPRDPSRRTMGPAVVKVSRLLRGELMPWQELAATVGGEVDDAGQYVWPLVIVSVPRQSGKSWLMLVQAVHRCLQGPDRRVWFTAQTGKDAVDLFREFAGRLLKSPLRELIATGPRGPMIAYRGGSESITFTNGSTLRPFAPGRDALHGKQSDFVSIDEGWAFDEVDGAAMFQAITPTQATRPGAQTWIWSTRGDAASVWFHGLVDRGLAGSPGVALFDYGLPDGVEPTVENVAAHHPAVGHTQTLDSLRAAQVSMGDKPAEYARAYGNQATGARERIIPADAWDAARVEADLPAGRPAYGVAVWQTPGGGDVHGALVAGVAGPAGPMLELVEARPGRAWLVDRVRELQDAGQGVAIVPNGPAGPVADALEVAGVELLKLSTADYAAACQDLWDRLCDADARAAGPRVWHRDDEELDAAVDVAGRRWREEGGWVFSAKHSTGNIAALQAAALACRAVGHAPAPFEIQRGLVVA